MRIAMLLVLLSPTSCLAQGAAVGSARVLAENQARAAAEAQNKLNTDAQGANAQASANTTAGASARPTDPRIEWQQAKKLRVIKELPKAPRPASECMKPSALQEGESGLLECSPCAVVQVIDKKSVILNLSGVPVLLQEYPTQGLVRNELVRLVGPVKVLGMKANPNRAGAVSQLRELQFVPLDELSGSKDDRTSEAAESYRTFTDATGKYTFSGRFIEFKEGSAHFVREDNQQPLAVKIVLLSEADQQWIRDELKARREK